MASTTSKRVPIEAHDCAPLAPEIASRGMNLLCHRCGANLSASELFCPNCGSPQLKFAQQEEGETGYAGGRPPGAPTASPGNLLEGRYPGRAFRGRACRSAECRLRVVLGMLPVGGRGSGAGYRRVSPAGSRISAGNALRGAHRRRRRAYRRLQFRHCHRHLAGLCALCSAPGLRHRSVLRLGDPAIDRAWCRPIPMPRPSGATMSISSCPRMAGRLTR